MSSDKSIIFNNLGSQIALTGYLFILIKSKVFFCIYYTLTLQIPFQFFFSFSLFTSPSKFVLLHSECLRCIGKKYGLMVDLILQYVTETNEMKTACLVWILSVFEMVHCCRLEKNTNLGKSSETLLLAYRILSSQLGGQYQLPIWYGTSWKIFGFILFWALKSIKCFTFFFIFSNITQCS